MMKACSHLPSHMGCASNTQWVTAISIIILLLISLVSGCASTSQKQYESAATESRIYEEVLPNGLKVIALKDHNAPLSVFQIWYNAGSIYEPLGKSGLSHLLEHMMFKGTQKYGPKTFSRIIKRAGGIDNAGTSLDFAYYYQKLASDRLSLSIELEADRMQNLVMNPEATISERDVVMEERRMRYEDDPQSTVYEELIATAFKNHPYRRPVIGWMEDLKTLTQENLWNYYKTRYVPNNALIIIAGDIDIEPLMKKIRELFGSIPRGDEIPALQVSEPEQHGEKRFYVKKEAELPYILSAYKVPNVLDEDSFPLEVLSAILSGGKSARIYRSLIDEKQIALSAGAGYSGIYKYPFLFYLYGTALPGKKIEDVEAALYDEIEKIKKQAPSAREVQKAKNQIEAEFIMSQDSLFYQAMMLGQFEIIKDWRLKDSYVEGIRNVTPEDVLRVANTYLVEDKRTVGILVPVQMKR